jgi:hypothetical protein
MTGAHVRYLAASFHAPRVRPSTSRDSGFLLSCRGPVFVVPIAGALERRRRSNAIAGDLAPIQERCACRRANWLWWIDPRGRQRTLRDLSRQRALRARRTAFHVPNRNLAGSQGGLAYHIWNRIAVPRALTAARQSPTPDRAPARPSIPSKFITHSNVSNLIMEYLAQYITLSARCELVRI